MNHIRTRRLWIPLC